MGNRSILIIEKLTKTKIGVKITNILKYNEMVHEQMGEQKGRICFQKGLRCNNLLYKFNNWGNRYNENIYDFIMKM